MSQSFKPLFCAVLLFLPYTSFADEAVPTTPLLVAIEQAASADSVPGLSGTPAPVWKQSACSASLFCPNGCGQVSCSGSSACTIGSSSVTCDGVTTNCPVPSCSAPIGCDNPCAWCNCRASGKTAFQCRFSCGFDPP